MLLGRKATTNPDNMLKSGDNILTTKVCRVKAVVFQKLCTDVRVEPQRKLSAEELMFSNCGAGVDY